MFNEEKDILDWRSFAVAFHFVECCLVCVARHKIHPLCRKYVPNELSTFITPRYAFADDEGYDFLVKYPDYLQLTGNLSVGTPVTDSHQSMFTDGLIIWPLANGGYEYGVILFEENGDNYQIHIDAQGKALNASDNEVVARHKDNIEKLIAKAHDMWGVI